MIFLHLSVKKFLYIYVQYTSILKTYLHTENRKILVIVLISSSFYLGYKIPKDKLAELVPISITISTITTLTRATRATNTRPAPSTHQTLFLLLLCEHKVREDRKYAPPPPPPPPPPRGFILVHKGGAAPHLVHGEHGRILPHEQVQVLRRLVHLEGRVQVQVQPHILGTYG